MGLRWVSSIYCRLILLSLLALFNSPSTQALTVRSPQQNASPIGRERVSLNAGWRFMRSENNPDGLSYDKLKSWILPAANDFIADKANHHERPASNPTDSAPFVEKTYDDSDWETVTLPHDWAIKGPFYTQGNPPVGGGMGRLPVHGVGWYRQKISIEPADEGKLVYLDIDGAMSYAMVWLNGNLVGGWPYGYNSFRLDLTPYLVSGEDNQLAIRLDNPRDSSRWYPGGGIYRNVWLTKVNPTHVANWGTHIISKDVSAESASLDLVVQIKNKADSDQQIEVVTDVHIFDPETELAGEKVSTFPSVSDTVAAGETKPMNASLTMENPQLWGPLPAQTPNLYVAVTHLSVDGEEVDTYETRFGVRSLTYDPDQGVLVNGELVKIQGVNNHHDLGALGAAFNVRAAERQLEILQEMGCNAIRMAHNPPASELLDLADRMGFLVMDEVFDCWEREKTPNDFHLIFPDWHEPDLRAFMRRDRNHPSIIAWSVGNEVGEQYTDTAGEAIGRMLRNIAFEEDPTRPSTASMNYAKPDMPFPRALDMISLNYQGEGIRDAPAYSHLEGIKTSPLYPAFHEKFPEKVIVSSETAAAISSRGTYIFPVTDGISAPITDSSGGNSRSMYVSAYELYTANFGASPDKVFSSQDHHPYVAGEFVWSGWDYLGEPTPYYSARSSYFGIIDLAGFKKDRFYLYQSRWNPDLPMAHILPHWNWPDRVGQVTPVHVFSSGDEAELFLDGESQGRLQKEEFTYRFRWDEIRYQPGELHVVTYKNGEMWANDTVRTTERASELRMTADRTTIKNDGYDLSFVTVEVVDGNGDVVRQAGNAITFSVSGPGELVATDNGDPTDMVAFPSKTRKAFGGLALAIVRSEVGASEAITITATGEGLVAGEITLETE